MANAKSYLENAGGKTLLLNWLRAGVLPYAICQFLLTGKSKKSLEILRNGVSLKINNKLRKRYAKFLDGFEKKQSLLSEPSRKVWVCWMQGMEQAPELVQKCYKSVCSQLADREVILLTDDNIKQYANLPQFIWDKYEKGIITRTHFSDLLRIALLAEHGGTWIDATVYCSDTCSIPTYMLESEFFVFQNLKPGADASVLNASSWFMSARKGSFIVLSLRELLWKYWEKENRLIDYFLLHHFMTIVCHMYPEEWGKIPQYPNSTPHILLLSFFKQFEKERYELMMQNCPVHKLSYKFKEEQMSLGDTNYKHFIEI